MKFNYSYLFIILFIVGCAKSGNEESFIKETTGRYLFNADATIEVYFKENELYLKWNAAENIKPLKIDETTFFVKEMNEKIQFLTNPDDGIMYICLVPKEETDIINYNYKKLADDFKTPGEHFRSGDYDKALEGFVVIQENDSLNPIIEEGRINGWGYSYMGKKEYGNAAEVFKINVALYPNSSNVYDSYGEALLNNTDTINAIINYKKSLELDSGNRNAKRILKKLEKK